MATPTVYVICDANCKFEGMTKEQILTAITQAVSEGTISDVDTGFVKTIKTINNKPLKFFVGTQAEYEALTEEDKKDLFAIISNDSHKEGIESTLYELGKSVQELEESTRNLTTAVESLQISTKELQKNQEKQIRWALVREFHTPSNADYGIAIGGTRTIKDYYNSVDYLITTDSDCVILGSNDEDIYTVTGVKAGTATLTIFEVGTGETSTKTVEVVASKDITGINISGTGNTTLIDPLPDLVTNKLRVKIEFGASTWRKSIEFVISGTKASAAENGAQDLYFVGIRGLKIFQFSAPYNDTMHNVLVGKAYEWNLLELISSPDNAEAVGTSGRVYRVWTSND